jgi:phosphoribosylaminoimidazolecarboxamide formyltransferase/IMP cyclohydrolase
MIDLVPVRRALLSVSDKTDVVAFARALVAHGVELVSTGGTAAMLGSHGIPVVPIEQLTGFPEMLDGRVKTLHPRVHGGLLGRRDNPAHCTAMAEHGIVPIDLVCVNLYPFEETIRRDGVSEAEAVENIDIGGPSMIRSAAKNFSHVCVVTSPSQYDRVCADLRTHAGSTTGQLRRDLAASAFARTAAYDNAIAAWFAPPAVGEFPNTLSLSYSRLDELRYGENPHQRSAAYIETGSRETAVVGSRLLHGKALSYNNLLDASAALELAQDLTDLPGELCACAIIKHTNPCGAAIASTSATAFERAYAGDPLAAYGSIVAFNRTLDAATAAAMVAGERFLEVVIAEAFEPAALEALASRWKNARLIALGSLRHRIDRPLSYRSIPGGMLVQERDTLPIRASTFQHVAGPPPSAEMLADAALGTVIVKHLKSNAVCIVGGGSLWGAGAGQMDRVASCGIAIDKARTRLAQPSATPVAASDAFFPFADGPERLIRAGVKCLVHPGGSKRDADTVELCQREGVTCLTTGTRHFRH